MWIDARDPADGIIVASSSESHYIVAWQVMLLGVPVLIEKPVCMRSEEAEDLLEMGGIVFAGHTRLYDPAWKAFKAHGKPKAVEAWAGGVNLTNPDANLNWWTHLAAMCWDLGFDPANAVFHVTEEAQPIRFVADGREFRDGEGALEGLITEFCAAIQLGKPNNEGLKLGLKAIQYVEASLPAQGQAAFSLGPLEWISRCTPFPRA